MKVTRSKVVVTGGAGFIGSHIVDLLIDSGYETHVVDNLVEGLRENVNSRAHFHEKDVRDGAELSKIFKNTELVFHLAAMPRVQYTIDFPSESNAVNVIGTYNVLNAAKENWVKRVVFSSTSAVYGDQDALVLSEDLAPNPKSPYGFHKVIGEQYCKLMSSIYGLETVSLRYFNAYGPRQNPNSAYALVIPLFIKMKSEGKPLTITGDGEQTRDFVHVSDIARANLLAACSDQVGRGEVINIGSGNKYSINQIAGLIGGPSIHIAPRLEPKHTLADVKLAKKILKWEPQVKLEDGLKELLKS